jgi:hypothetical protein
VILRLIPILPHRELEAHLPLVSGKQMRKRDRSYFVLRFLAEDAGKRLDQVLDMVLAALIHREMSKPR